MAVIVRDGTSPRSTPPPAGYSVSTSRRSWRLRYQRTAPGTARHQRPAHAPGRHPVAHTSRPARSSPRSCSPIVRPDGQRRWLAVSSRLLNPEEWGTAAVCSIRRYHRVSGQPPPARIPGHPRSAHRPREPVADPVPAVGGIGRQRGYQRVSTVMFIDLDGFKSINDTMGHAIGDTVLRIVAHRLQRALRAEDLVGRLGGDEFLVLLAGRPGDEELEPLVRRLRAAMAEPIIARGHRIAVNASIGVTTRNPATTAPRKPYCTTRMWPCTRTNRRVLAASDSAAGSARTTPTPPDRLPSPSAPLPPPLSRRPRAGVSDLRNARFPVSFPLPS